MPTKLQLQRRILPPLCQARGSILCPSAPKMLLMPLRHSGSLLSSISCAGEKTFTGQGLAVPPEGTWENLDQPPTVLFILCTLAPLPDCKSKRLFSDAQPQNKTGP